MSEKVSFAERLFDASALESVRSLPQSVHLHFHFAPHAEVKDFKELPELFKACDVFIPEVDVWDDEAIREHQLVALGDKRAYQGLRIRTIKANPLPDAKLFELKMMYGGHKKVTLIGPHYESPIAQNLRDLLYSPDVPLRWVDLGQTMHDREEEMVRSLGPNVNRLIAQTPKLAAKQQINVLLNMGNAHTAVHKAAAEVLNQPHYRRVTRSFNELPSRYDFMHALMRNIMFGQEITQESALELKTRIDRFPEVDWASSV